jgi:hypothetical protein
MRDTMGDRMGERIKMKPAIAIPTAILVSVLAAGLASAQNPSIIQNTRNTMNAVSSHNTAASNEALGMNQSAPAAGAPKKPSSSSTNAHRAAQPTVSATQTPAKQHAAATTAKAPAKTPSSQTVAHVADGKGSRHLRRYWRNGVLVQEWVPGAGPAEGPLPGSAPEDLSASGDASASPTSGGDGGGYEANEQSVVPDPKYAANGRRDPFISPVVSHAGGSGCSTGKKCLEIGAINLRGVVHGESGFIAVVSNGLNKAYFLRENDPVFNGYVVKITGDSIVFQETLQDRLGKTFTREVVKKITTPAV